MEPPLMAFFRHIGVPHAYWEFLVPCMRSKRAAMFTATQIRPWPPWGLGSVNVHALALIFPIEKDWASIGNIFLLDEDVANIHLSSAIYASCLDYLSNIRGIGELRHVVDEDSILAARVLTALGFSPTGNPYIAPTNKQYQVYSAPIDNHKSQLGLTGTKAATLLGGSINDQLFSNFIQLFCIITLGTQPFWSPGSTFPDIIPNALAAVDVSGGAPKRRP